MDAKEKAMQLVGKQFNVGIIRCDFYFSHAKEHALIMVNEMLNVCDHKTKPYLEEVKQEIEKL